MQYPNWQPQAPLQRMHLDWLRPAGVELAILRLDLLDEHISGNKWFKLAPYLQQAAEQGFQGLMSLGGAHSNHLHALAAAGARFGFATLGLLRGAAQDNPTVADLQGFGMQLHWLGYGAYRQRYQADFWDAWRARYPQLLPVDEGGSGLPGARGCAPLVAQINQQLANIGWSDYQELWVACGTGTTLAGLVLGEGGRHPVVGAMAVPLKQPLREQVASWVEALGAAPQDYRLLDASRGGFARLDAELASFILDCEAQSAVPLEPLYTGKLLLALRDALRCGQLAHGSRIVAIHSGGLQGRRSLQQQLLQLARR